MRELALIETGYLCGLLFVSLLVPLFARGTGGNGATKAFNLRAVLSIELLLALAGVGVLVSSWFAPYAFGVGLVSFVCFVGYMLLTINGEVVKDADR